MATLGKPVVDYLFEKRVSVGSRISYCTTVPLAQLPIHSCGPYRNEEKNMPDIFVSSYNPNPSSLIISRDRAALRLPLQPSVAAVGQIRSSGSQVPPLPKVEQEINNVKEIFNTSAAVYLDEAATDTSVLEYTFLVAFRMPRELAAIAFQVVLPVA
ncbi:hypothetical protein CPB84DRAFT_1846956 [Gymnopilus junonius]|uniref:Uncharacterized protein n=1 Tax=Gymnopilus junonius TaxID=109634 RepID=A0A9P5NR73_GYMJU|nr:hypothetical protein CPB84DRAFT_1846956 [Gymnopilus junonius]